MARLIFEGREHVATEVFESVRIRPPFGVFLPGKGDHGHCDHATGEIELDDATATIVVGQGQADVVRSTIVSIRPRFAPPPAPPEPPTFQPRRKAA